MNPKRLGIHSYRVFLRGKDILYLATFDYYKQTEHNNTTTTKEKKTVHEKENNHTTEYLGWSTIESKAKQSIVANG